MFTRNPEEHYLLLTAHHIICDFWSFAVLMHEMGTILSGRRAGVLAERKPLALEYTDFVRWQAETMAGPVGERLWAYWKEQLGDLPPQLDLPADRPRPALPTHHGASVSLTLDAALTDRLNRLGAANGSTLFVTLLAAFQALLARLSGQEDLIVGVPTAGRDRRELSDLVGYFVNPLPIRGDLSGNPTFREFLSRTRRVVIEGLEHQGFPFALMVDRLEPSRDPSRAPLFQVMFVFQKSQRLQSEALTPFALRGDGPRLDLGGFPLESVALEKRTSPFDLTLMVAESEGGLAAALEYSTDLFDAGTVERLLGHFRNVLEAIVADPGQPVAALPLQTAAERQRVVVEWNRTEARFPRERPVHERIEDAARKDPDAVALMAEGGNWTYREVVDCSAATGETASPPRYRARGARRPLCRAIPGNGYGHPGHPQGWRRLRPHRPRLSRRADRFDLGGCTSDCRLDPATLPQPLAEDGSPSSSTLTMTAEIGTQSRDMTFPKPRSLPRTSPT